MPKTTLDVVTAGARLAGVAAVDVPLDSQDYANCEPIYLSMMDALFVKDDFYELSDPNAVPLWAFNPVFEMLGLKIAAHYGRPPPVGADWDRAHRSLSRYHTDDDRDVQPPKEAAYY